MVTNNKKIKKSLNLKINPTEEIIEETTEEITEEITEDQEEIQETIEEKDHLIIKIEMIEEEENPLEIEENSDNYYLNYLRPLLNGYWTLI